MLPEDHLVGTKAHGWPPVPGGLVFSGRPGQPRHDQARHDKSEETQQQPLPMTARNKIKSSQGNAHPQQQAAEEPKRRPFGRNALANRPPKAAEENRAEQHARHQRQRQSQDFIHRHPPVPPASPCLPWPPNATHSNSRSTSPATSSASVQECAARIVLVQPDTERRAEQRRNHHRPADQPHHAQAEPDALRGVTPRLELARRLRADLPTERRLGLRASCFAVRHS